MDLDQLFTVAKSALLPTEPFTQLYTFFVEEKLLSAFVYLVGIYTDVSMKKNLTKFLCTKVFGYIWNGSSPLGLSSFKASFKDVSKGSKTERGGTKS